MQIKSIMRNHQWQPTPVPLPGKSHGWRSLVGCSPWGRQESDTTERLPFHFLLSRTGEGHGNPLQCSCLENPRDGGAWWAAVHGVAQSRTRLTRLSSSGSTTTYLLEWLKFVKTPPNFGQDVKHLELSYTDGGNVKWYKDLGKHSGSFLKTKCTPTIQSRHFTLGHQREGMRACDLTQICTQTLRAGLLLRAQNWKHSNVYRQ